MVQKIDALFKILRKTSPALGHLKAAETLSFKMVPTQKGISLAIVDRFDKQKDYGYEVLFGPRTEYFKGNHQGQGAGGFHH